VAPFKHKTNDNKKQRVVNGYTIILLPPIVNMPAITNRIPIEMYKSMFRYILRNNAPPNKSALILMKTFSIKDKIDKSSLILLPPNRFFIYSGMVNTPALFQNEKSNNLTFLNILKLHCIIIPNINRYEDPSK
jgi:hypothetical protein